MCGDEDSRLEEGSCTAPLCGVHAVLSAASDREGAVSSSPPLELSAWDA